jgi:hypothetical protein
MRAVHIFIKYLKSSKKIANGSRKRTLPCVKKYVKMFRRCEKCRKVGGQPIRSFASQGINEHKFPVEVSFVSSETAAIVPVLRPQI